LAKTATSDGVRGRKAVISSGTTRRRWDGLRRFAPLAVVILLAAAAYGLGWHQALSPENLARHHAVLTEMVDRHVLLALAAYVSVYAVAVTLSLPCGAILTTTGGVLFGTLLGGSAAVVGATIGATGLFLVARSAFGEFLIRRAGPRLAALANGFRKNAFNYLLFLRLVPIFPFFLVNLAPALVGVRLAPFVAATAIGIVPATFVFACVGSEFADAIAAQAQTFHACEKAGGTDCRIDFDLSEALTPQLIVALVSLGLLALIPVAMKQLQARKQRS